jgi:hypothetical protein
MLACGDATTSDLLLEHVTGGAERHIVIGVAYLATDLAVLLGRYRDAL